MFDEIQRFRTFNRFKSVYRRNSVGDRKESCAEHTWSALVLADMFLTHNTHNLDTLRVYELLLYHDAVEIITGDTPLHPDVPPEDKTQAEALAAQELARHIPQSLKHKYLALHNEYAKQRTPEARFAKAVDALDALILALDHPEDFEGYTKEFFLEKKGPVFEEFPEIKDVFYDVLTYIDEQGHFQ